jgi:heme exporter protein CcmD
MVMQEFLAMGGYGGFVWPSYGLAALVFGWNIWSARSAHGHARLQAERRIAMAASPGQHASAGDRQ